MVSISVILALLICILRFDVSSREIAANAKIGGRAL
jgi:hypothetical protein